MKKNNKQIITNTQKSIKKETVLDLMNTFDQKFLERNLIRLFINSHQIGNVKNELISSILEKSNGEKLKKLDLELKNKNINLTLNSLTRIFELLVPEGDREINGVYYTPENIVRYMVDLSISSNQIVCDCSCGGGAFLLEAAKKLKDKTSKSYIDIIEENIYGVDLLNYNVRRAKIILSLLAIKNGEDKEQINFNIKQGNSLKINWGEYFPKIMKNNGGFDVIIGNPPYIKIQLLEDEMKEYLLNNYKTVKKGNFNIYIPFIELGINLINKDGELCYITPLNYFTTLTGETLRNYLQNNRYVEKVIDFNHHRVFNDVLAYTAITLFNRKRKSSLEYAFVKNEEELNHLDNIDFVNVNYKNLNPKKWRLLDENDYENIKKIEDEIPLTSISGIHTGIATLKDEVYMINTENEQNNYYRKSLNDEEYLIEKSICREIVKISSISNQKDLERNTLKMIFPYEPQTSTIYKTLDGQEKKIEKDFKIIPEEKLKKEYPKTYDYLKAAKDKLASRDKGKGKDYEPWYKYGRKQGVQYYGERLYTPTYSKGPKFLLHRNEKSLFCNGYAIFPKKIDIMVLQKILNSKVMDYYMKKTSKDIEGNFQCYQKNFLKRFSIPKLTNSEKDKLLSLEDQEKINDFLIDKYDIEL